MVVRARGPLRSLPRAGAVTALTGAGFLATACTDGTARPVTAPAAAGPTWPPGVETGQAVEI